MSSYTGTHQILVVLLISLALWSAGGTYGELQKRAHASKEIQASAIIAHYSQKELAYYNGTEAGKPILLAFEGDVYDISAGREFYMLGGTYHFLAGKDSTVMLHIAGGNIIKKKYPIVGKYIP